MALLLSGTRVYGNTNIDSVLVLGNTTPDRATSNTTGSLRVTGGAGIVGNVYTGNIVISTGNTLTFGDGTVQTTAASASGLTYIFANTTSLASNIAVANTLSFANSAYVPIIFANGSTLVTPVVSNAHEYDGSSLYITSANTSNGAGRQIISASQLFNLDTPVGVASAAQYFAPPQRPQLVAGHTYEFKYYLSFKKLNSGTVTFSFSNLPSTNFVFLNAIVNLTSQSGFGAANTIGIYANNATTTTSTASPVTLNANGGYVARIEGIVEVVANTRLQLLVTTSAGTIAANTGSLYYITDLGTNSIVGNIG
jgi:hypothetical protein